MSLVREVTIYLVFPIVLITEVPVETCLENRSNVVH